MYRTSNQAYGSRAPTVHEMPVSGKQGRARERVGRLWKRPRPWTSQKGNTSWGWYGRGPKLQLRIVGGVPRILLAQGRVEINGSSHDPFSKT